MGFFSQLGLLLWKNFLLQRRKICVSIFEVILPIVFAVIILIIRIAAKPKEFDRPIYYDSKPVRSSDFRYRYMDPDVEVGFTPNTALTRRIMADVVQNLEGTLTKQLETFVVGK
ncbi:hypothetical protein BaRGS_00023655 [Batillaria attramentaria]|uniref:Uncharacterized protein n=1 Tax=Batillaria attramentaria TaxID=370345 RepID=A0ABD0KDC1_9CAEN